MEDKDFNTKLSKLLTEETDISLSREEDPETELISVCSDLEDEEGGILDFFIEPKTKEVIKSRTIEGQTSVESIPFSEFKPEVYGLSDDIFDSVEIPEIEEIEYNPGDEEVKNFNYGKKYSEAENETQEVGEDSFKDIDDDSLLEYAERKGVDYTTRKKTIQTLFEHNRVTKEDIESFKNINKKQKLNESVLLLEEDSFISKFGEDLDLRNIEEQSIINSSLNPSIYKALDNMSPEDWEEYQNELKISGVLVSYDPIKDIFLFQPDEETDEDEDLYDIEDEDKKVIENIVKNTDYSLLEVKGLPRSTKKEYIMEIVVRKDNYNTTIRYNDEKITKPWSIGQKEFNTLKESLNSIFIPFKHLVEETTRQNKTQRKSPTFTEIVSKESKHLSKNLPLTIKEQREQRGKELVKQMFKETYGTKHSQLDEFDTDEWIVESNGYNSYTITPGYCGEVDKDECFSGSFEQLLVYLKNEEDAKSISINSETGEIPNYIRQQVEQHGLEFIS